MEKDGDFSLLVCFCICTFICTKPLLIDCGDERNNNKRMQGRVKLSCVRYMLLLVPRSVVGPLCEGPCSFPWWQRLAVCSVGSRVSV